MKIFAQPHFVEFKKMQVKVMNKLLYIGFILFFLFSFGSCKKNKPKDKWDDTLYTGIIKVACDENFSYLMEAEIASFEANSNYQATIFPVYSNESEVINMMLDDSVRLVLTTRKLNSLEQRTVKEKKMFVRENLIAYEGISLIINKANQDSLIGIPTLRKILLGEITEWSQINPESPLGTIRVIFDSNRSGTLRYIVDSIAKTTNLSSNLYAMQSSEELIEKVCQLPNAIGIVGYNIIINKDNWRIPDLQNKLRLMRVGKEENANLQNTFYPFVGDIKSEDYPLWRAIYILLSDPRSGLSSGFSIFLANDIGQTVILKSGLFPAVTDPYNRSVYVTPK